MADTIRSLINRCARELKSREFLVDPESNLHMTYGALHAHCREFGGFLHSAGFSAPANVGFMMDNGYWSSVVFLGTMYSGHISIPLNVVASRRNLLFALANAKVDIVFVSAPYRAMLNDLLTEIDREVQVVDVDMASGFEMPAVDSADRPYRALSVMPNSPAMIMHTSGTVGLPKGAVLRHSNMIAGAHNVKKAHQLSLDDAAYCVLPLYHINGQVVTLIAPIVSHSRVVMPRRFSVSNYWEHVIRYNCTWVSLVPTMAKYLLDAVGNSNEKKAQIREQLRHLRFARSASSSLPAGMHRDFEETFGVPMIETMGLTETAAPILANPMPPALRVSGSVGLPCGNEVKVIDADEITLREGEIGEIVVRGDNVISEYFNAPQATLTSFTSDGWFKTGDLGYYDEYGYFFVTGRIKELIIKGGENISPREIDDVLYHHDAVLEAGAFGFPDDAYGQVVAVAVVLKEGVDISEDALIEFCSQELGSFRCPSRIFFVDDLPKGPSGKIQRLEVAKLIIENQ